MTRLLLLAALAWPAIAAAASDPSLQAEYELPGAPAPALRGLTPAPPAGYQRAPMPNPDLLPPAQTPLAADPSLRPRLFMPPNRFAGDGYTDGSTVQTEQERRMRPAAGFSLQLPFR